MQQPPKRRFTLQRIVFEQAGDRAEPLALCPRKRSVIEVAGCKHCPYFAGLSIGAAAKGAQLRCVLPEEDAATDDEQGVGVVAEGVVEHSPIGQIMSTLVRCATAEMSLDDFETLLLAERISALPVIDLQGIPIGIATKTNALQQRRLGATSVGEIMSRSVFSMGAASSIGRVAAVMAHEQVHHVLIVSEAGAILGIVSSLDIACWVARQDGYVVSRPPSS